MHGGVGLEFRRVQHLESGCETGELAVRRPQEHVVDEQRVPRVWRDEPNR